MHILYLQPMLVISFHAFGESPEGVALDKLFAWAKGGHKIGRVFGFNNPNPGIGSPEYGYEVWMPVSPGLLEVGEGRLQYFSGGQYAVLRCTVRRPWEDIPAAWERHVAWLAGSEYQRGTHQWLEEHLDPESAAGGATFKLDLFLPIHG